MLHKISAGGIIAYCSDLVVDPENKEQAYFLSVAGYQTAVKGILANLLENNQLTIIYHSEIHWIQRCPESYFMKVKKLPSGYCHGLAFLRIALPQHEENDSDPEFLVISNHPDKVKSLFYKHLEEKIEIPLHPSWAEWLWRLHETKEWLIKLESVVGIHEGYLIRTDPEELQVEIAEAIMDKVPEVIECLKCKGGKNHG